MRSLKSRFAILLACFWLINVSNANENDEEQEDMSSQKATLRVETSGLGDYVDTIVRILSVRDSDNKEIYQRPFIGGYLKSIKLEAPGTYTVKVLCERWYLLEFEKPLLEITVEPNKEYLVSCLRNKDEVKAIATEVS